MAHDFNPQRIEAAVMLHTEFATWAEVSAPRAKFHLAAVQPLLVALTAPSRADVQTRQFIARWYVVAIGTLLARGDEGGAHSYANKAVAAFPADRSLRFWQGYVEERRDRWDSAAVAYRLALARDAAFAEARLRLGWVLTRQDQYDAAQRELEAARDAAQAPVIRYLAHLFLGRIREHARDLEGAAREYEAARAIGPSCQTAVVALSVVEEKLGYHDKARALVTQFAAWPRSRAPFDPWWSYQALAIDVEALAWLRNAVR